MLKEVISLSNPNLVTASEPEARPPAEIFGEEPAHQWCYYFEKADLARQRGDWQQITHLAEQAFRLGTRLYEINAPELLPYIEGYGHIGQWDKAAELSNQAFELTFRMRGMLCTTWKRLEQTTQPNPQRETVLKTVRNELSCEKP